MGALFGALFAAGLFGLLLVTLAGRVDDIVFEMILLVSMTVTAVVGTRRLRATT